MVICQTSLSVLSKLACDKKIDAHMCGPLIMTDWKTRETKVR